MKIKCSYTVALRTEEPQNHRKILLKLLNLNSSARNSGECWLRVWKARHQEALPLHLVYSQQCCQALGPWGCSPPFLYKSTLSCPPFTSPSSTGTKQWGDLFCFSHMRWSSPVSQKANVLGIVRGSAAIEKGTGFASQKICQDSGSVTHCFCVPRSVTSMSSWRLESCFGGNWNKRYYTVGSH